MGNSYLRQISSLLFRSQFSRKALCLLGVVRSGLGITKDSISSFCFSYFPFCFFFRQEGRYQILQSIDIMSLIFKHRFQIKIWVKIRWLYSSRGNYGEWRLLNIHEFALFQYSIHDFSFLHRIERLKVIARFFFSWITTTLKRPLYK